jgi:hypothetical protein
MSFPPTVSSSAKSHSLLTKITRLRGQQARPGGKRQELSATRYRMPGISNEQISLFGTGLAAAPPNITLYGILQMLKGAMGMTTKCSCLHTREDSLKLYSLAIELSLTHRPPNFKSELVVNEWMVLITENLNITLRHLKQGTGTVTS